nr:HDIG domain-containing metalloprotein [uncultured Caproiciproducens sp.]
MKQNLYDAMERHLLEDDRPSEYFEGLEKTVALREYPFAVLHSLKNAEQSPEHHPEGNVWNHTMLVVDEAAKIKAKSSDEKVFMWAALLHDIGKQGTTRIRRGKITSYDHDSLGAKMAAEFLKQFSGDEEFIQKTAALVRWHMQLLFVVNNLPFADVEKMKQQTSVQDVALLGLCDRLGRLRTDRQKEEENVRIFLEKCK